MTGESPGPGRRRHAFEQLVGQGTRSRAVSNEEESSTMSATALAEPTLLDAAPGEFSCFAWEDTTIIVWLKGATGPATSRLRVVTEEVARAHPEGFSNIHLVAYGAALPTAEAKRGFADLMTRYEKELACVATVFEGSGFWASALRSMNTGLQMLAQRPFPMRVLKDIDEVADWVPAEHLRHTGRRLQPRHLHAALSSARAYRAP